MSYDAKQMRDALGLKDAPILNSAKPNPEIITQSLVDVISQEDLFSPEECKQIIHDNMPDEWDVATVNEGADNEAATLRADIRSAKSAWLEPGGDNIWLYDKLLAIITAANEFYKFDIDYFEQVQLVKYDTGDFYDYHVDLGPERMGNRKLSVTVQLTAGEDYIGGDLVVDVCDTTDGFHAPRGIGSVTVFPSFLKHCVQPVAAGTRYSVVVWCSGTRRFR